MKFNQCGMTLRNLSPQPRVEKIHPKNALTWQTIGLELSNLMTTVRLRKFKLSFLNELLVTCMKCARGQETRFRTKIQQIFWDEQGTSSSQRNQTCRGLNVFRRYHSLSNSLVCSSHSKRAMKPAVLRRTNNRSLTVHTPSNHTQPSVPHLQH